MLMLTCLLSHHDVVICITRRVIAVDATMQCCLLRLVLQVLVLGRGLHGGEKDDLVTVGALLQAAR